MGLTAASVGHGAADAGLVIRRRSPRDRVIALAGNPNVGKSTVFNGLTGMNQHTGNWPGKTVTNAQGFCESARFSYIMVDIPGTYSLLAHSAEEEVARDFLCFGEPDAVVVVCDATCLSRSLNLVLQIMECGRPVVVCVNLLDEARRKKIEIDLDLLSARLGVLVVGTVARRRRSLQELLRVLDRVCAGKPQHPLAVTYPAPIEAALDALTPLLRTHVPGCSSRWLGLQLLDRDPSLHRSLCAALGEDVVEDERLIAAVEQERTRLEQLGLDADRRRDLVVAALVRTAEEVCAGAVRLTGHAYASFDRRLDRILTGRLFGYPVMLALLALVFWLTIVGANFPSQLLARLFAHGQEKLLALFALLHAPDWLTDAAVGGVYRVLSWVVSVMLPPMAIFFPLFTLLEDAGYLPRVAYNLDRPFRRCHACGKQALCMCMGFGCNAAGVIGCRIIDSPRERLLAVLTNNFVPCNGRFPMLITLLTLFFAGAGAGDGLRAALLLTALILFGVGMTFFVTYVLSRTLLRGQPSSFTLELPPYRRPQIGRVLVRSVFDRTLFVLGRAAAVAAPAGLLIWLLANLRPEGVSLLARLAALLDPVGRCFGMDGVILLAFALGFPANEIVVPVMVMTYLAQGTLTEIGPAALYTVLTANGWTGVTAVCVLLFSLMHWPCSTTLLTIRRETGSLRWTLLAAAVPTAAGLLCCFAVAAGARLLGW